MLDGQIEQDLSALLDSRTRPLPSPALRRLAATTNSEANAPGSADAPAMAAPAADASAPTSQPVPEGTEHSAISLFALGANNRVLLTFIELEGYPILRVAINGECTDLILNNDQVKLLLRQMTLWLTR